MWLSVYLRATSIRNIVTTGSRQYCPDQADQPGYLALRAGELVGERSSLRARVEPPHFSDGAFGISFGNLRYHKWKILVYANGNLLLNLSLNNDTEIMKK